MRARHLSLAGFRGFASLEIDFDPRLTVLVGANGSGKTSILDAIALLWRGALYEVDFETSMREAAPSLRNGEKFGRATLRYDRPGRGGADDQDEAELNLYLSPNEVDFNGGLDGDLDDRGRSVPVVIAYPVDRSVTDGTPGSTTPSLWTPRRAWDTALDARADFVDLFRWFREREDLENEARVQDNAGADIRLSAVRIAIERAMPGFSHPHVRRPRDEPDEHPAFRKPTLALRKGGELFAFDQLSEGERSLIAIVADIARRLAIANVEGDPLAGAGMVMIDEVELHLHPKWQREILSRLLGVFPNLQFIVTTHSPLVLTDVPADQIRVLENFEVYEPAHPVRGRDAGSILAEVFDTNPLPAETQDAVAQISSLIDADRFDEARARLAELERKLGGLDVEVTRLRTAIDLLAS